MTEKKKVVKKDKPAATKKTGGEKQAPKMTSRKKILKYCEVEGLKGYKGEIIVFGTHKYRMNKPFADYTEAECDKIFKNLRENLELDAYIKQVEESKSIISKRKATTTTTTDPKPCECGCGAITRRGSRFKPGHDMKLKSALRRKATKHSNPATRQKAQKELKSRGWS